MDAAPSVTIDGIYVVLQCAYKLNIVVVVVVAAAAVIDTL